MLWSHYLKCIQAIATRYMCTSIELTKLQVEFACERGGYGSKRAQSESLSVWCNPKH